MQRIPRRKNTCFSTESMNLTVIFIYCTIKLVLPNNSNILGISCTGLDTKFTFLLWFDVMKLLYSKKTP